MRRFQKVKQACLLAFMFTGLINVARGQCKADFTSSGPGCAGESIDFYAADTLVGSTYLWDFGVGATPATSTLKDPTGIVYSSSGAKIVELTIDNIGFACNDNNDEIITINDNPSASFPNPASACMGDGVNFTNTSSTGVGITYLWDFGSGASPTSSTAFEPQGVTYSTNGSKTVTLIVDNGNCIATTTGTFTINTTPVAASASTAPACETEIVDFTNTGSTGGTWTYNWSFGSGASSASSTDENPLGITYSTSGTKTNNLTKTDAT